LGGRLTAPQGGYQARGAGQTGRGVGFFQRLDDSFELLIKVAKEKGYEIVDHSMVLYVKPLKK